jgi:hypothetical protein
MTPEATAHMIARLEKELFGIEREPARNVAERQYREFRAAEIRRAIENVKTHFKIGHP